MPSLHRCSPDVPESTAAALAEIVDLLLDAVCLVDAQGRFRFVSAASEQVFGYRPEELVGKRMVDFLHPDDAERTLAAAQQVLAGIPLPHFENRYVRKDGRTVHVMWTARWSDSLQARVGVARDVTSLRRAEAKQAASFAVAEAAHLSIDRDDLLSRVQAQVAALLPGLQLTVVSSDDVDAWTHVAGWDSADDRRAVRALADQVQRGDGTADALVAGRRIVGAPLRPGVGRSGALLVSVPSLPGHDVDTGELLHFVAAQMATALDRHAMEQQLRHLALHDSLTELPNRNLLRQRLVSAIDDARGEPRQLAVLYVDLDRFKSVNDTLGHSAGDLLLQQVGERLRDCVRSSDTVARIGGDEFLVLLPVIETPELASMIASKIGHCLALPFAIDSQQVQVSASIGVAVFPTDGHDDEGLIDCADVAMYRAKKEGGNRVCRSASVA